MNYHCEPEQKLPIIADVDVLVAGAGPAGFVAALSAARNGAKTMLVEQFDCPGGMATSGMMSHWVGAADCPIYHELLKRVEDNPWNNEKITSPIYINHEKTKLIMLEMLAEAGVEMKFYTFASGAIVENNQVKGIITESKSGREVIKAKITIDCTGDGDVAAKSGAEFTKGRENDGRMQPVTLMFKIAGVDDNAEFIGGFEDNRPVPAGNAQDLAREHIPAPAGHVLVYPSPIPGQAVVNMTNQINIDGTSSSDLTKAELECRRQMPIIMNFLQNYIPGYENCYVISSASQIGVRETRHFKGMYTLNEDDILDARLFDDWIAKGNAFNFDIHSLDGPGLDKNGAQRHFKSAGKYSIPYRSCIPEKIDGLLLAGRCISGTHKAHSNYRVMPICSNMGQGTGAAAALCVKENIQPRELDVEKIQQILIQQGVSE